MKHRLNARRATVLVALLSLVLSGCGAEHGDASFCTFLNETTVERFGYEVGHGFGLPFQKDIVDGRLRALASAVPLNIQAGHYTLDEGLDRLLDRCRAIRAL